MKKRLDRLMAERRLVSTRSQAESYIRLGQVKVDGRVVTKPGFMAAQDSKLELSGAAADEQYVSRAALKLASSADKLGLDFRGRTVLDVGSSTGGFTDYALKHGAAKVVAVDVGTDQLHPSLRQDPRVELHEKTDIRDFAAAKGNGSGKDIDVVLADVSFISLRDILPDIARLAGPETLLAVMVKPQFEAGDSDYKHKGVIKNDTVRRAILKDFETWAKGHGFTVLGKADSDVSGAKGNRERFYLLRKA